MKPDELFAHRKNNRPIAPMAPGWMRFPGWERSDSHEIAPFDRPPDPAGGVRGAVEGRLAGFSTLFASFQGRQNLANLPEW